jgi:hypothetical protein
MHRRGDLRRNADPDRLATALLAALQGGLILSKIRRNPAPLESALDTVIEHISSLTIRRRNDSQQSHLGKTHLAGSLKPSATRSE